MDNEQEYYEPFEFNDELLKILHNELQEITEQGMTFALDPQKALLISKICNQFRRILDECGAKYTIEVNKGVLINTHAYILVITDIFDAAHDEMIEYRSVINCVSEISQYVCVDDKIGIKLYIKDAFIRIDPNIQPEVSE